MDGGLAVSRLIVHGSSKTSKLKVSPHLGGGICGMIARTDYAYTPGRMFSRQLRAHADQPSAQLLFESALPGVDLVWVPGSPCSFGSVGADQRGTDSPQLLCLMKEGAELIDKMRVWRSSVNHPHPRRFDASRYRLQLR
jgi:hypothetical protein